MAQPIISSYPLPMFMLSPGGINRNKQSDKAMSVALVPVTTNTNKQAVMPKNIVPDPGWFDGNRTKFEDW